MSLLGDWRMVWKYYVKKPMWAPIEKCVGYSQYVQKRKQVLIVKLLQKFSPYLQDILRLGSHNFWAISKHEKLYK